MLLKEELTLINCEIALQLALVQMAYAYCPDCDHRNCENCEGFSYVGKDVSQFFPEGFHIKAFPPEMWDRVDQCCSCGSQSHVIEWLRKVWHPVAYVHAQASTSELPLMVRERLLPMHDIEEVLLNS